MLIFSRNDHKQLDFNPKWIMNPVYDDLSFNMSEWKWLLWSIQYAYYFRDLPEGKEGKNVIFNF